MPEGFKINIGKWACADGPQRAFDPHLSSFCIEGLCKSADPCLAEVEAAATKSWTCGIKTVQGCLQGPPDTPTGGPCKLLFTKIGATDANMSSAGFCRVKQKEEATEERERRLVLGVLVGTVFAICVGIMLTLVRRNPGKVKKSVQKVD